MGGQSTKEPARFGPYVLVRELSHGPAGERWLALHERDHSSHVVHRASARHDRGSQKRFFDSMERLSTLSHPHLLPIESYAVCPAGRATLVTPYTGNQSGLVTLGSLVELKGGRLSPTEADRALTHVLEGIDYAHRSGIGHGPVSAERVLVDRHGRAAIELYGLERSLRGGLGADAELVRDEVRSVAEIGYRLITGLGAEEPRIAAGRLVKKLSPAWDEWFERGLDGVAGFGSAAEAIEALPSSRRDDVDTSPRVNVLGVLSRFRWPSRSK